VAQGDRVKGSCIGCDFHVSNPAEVFVKKLDRLARNGTAAEPALKPMEDRMPETRYNPPNRYNHSISEECRRPGKARFKSAQKPISSGKNVAIILTSAPLANSTSVARIASLENLDNSVGGGIVTESDLELYYQNLMKVCVVQYFLACAARMDDPKPNHLVFIMVLGRRLPPTQI
jgi:hypothetical protein